MKKYTKNNSGIAIAEESRIFVDDGFGERCYPVPYAYAKGQFVPYSLRDGESLANQLIKEVEKQGHLVVQKSDVVQNTGNVLNDSGEIVLDLAVPDADVSPFLYAYIGISAGSSEAISSYPMFTPQIVENTKLTIGGDFGAATLDQIADLAKHRKLEITQLNTDVSDDNFIKEKFVYSGLQTDGDRLADQTFRLTQNDQYTENTKHRITRLGAGTSAGVVVLDGLHYLRVKVLKGIPVALTIHYTEL